MSADPSFALTARGYETDKGPHYLRRYEAFFRPLVDKEVRLLELGVWKGGSLLLWRDYFPRGTIVGLDISSVTIDDPTGRIRLYCGRQDDVQLLHRVAEEVAPGGFDIIIDDASHIASFTRTSFWCLFDHHLKPGGVYVIEDWGTGYWESWPDGHQYEGTPHTAGMVGFVKELVDECGMEDLTHQTRGVGPPRPSRIAFMQVSGGQIFVVKRAPDV